MLKGEVFTTENVTELLTVTLLMLKDMNVLAKRGVLQLMLGAINFIKGDYHV